MMTYRTQAMQRIGTGSWLNRGRPVMLPNPTNKPVLHWH